MKALVLDGNGLACVDDRPRPTPGPGEALIRVRLAGICATDLELVKGYAGFFGIPGHEFVGVVEACGQEEWVGKRVVGSINIACRACPVCHAGGPEHCPARSVLGIVGKDGVFAEYATLPLANLLEVPGEIEDREAVFTEPLAAALRILDQTVVSPAQKIIVVGPGRLGLLIAQVLALSGASVTVLGRRRESLALASRLGLEAGIVGEMESDSADFVVEATGNIDGFAQSLRIVRPRGTIILKSTFHGQASLDLTKVVVGELRVIGSRCGPFAPALNLLRRKAVGVRELIDGEFPLARGLEAFQAAGGPGARKILIRC